MRSFQLPLASTPRTAPVHPEDRPPVAGAPGPHHPHCHRRLFLPPLGSQLPAGAPPTASVSPPVRLVTASAELPLWLPLHGAWGTGKDDQRGFLFLSASSFIVIFLSSDSHPTPPLAKWELMLPRGNFKSDPTGRIDKKFYLPPPAPPQPLPRVLPSKSS